VTFVTGDQPAINTKGNHTNLAVPLTELELYYPLTPTLALLMNFDAESELTGYKTLSPEQVLEYNRQIVNVADKQIYAHSKAALDFQDLL